MKKEVTASTGDSLVLECYASGAPKPFMTWSKDGTLVRSDRHVVLAESGQLLVIAQVEEEDGGSYACQATNSQGKVKHTVEVLIETGM